MDTEVIVLPFTEKTVRVVEEYDPTVLVRIDGEPMEVVGRKSQARGPVKFRDEDGKWKCVTPQAVTVLEVEARDVQAKLSPDEPGRPDPCPVL